MMCGKNESMKPDMEEKKPLRLLAFGIELEIGYVEIECWREMVMEVCESSLETCQHIVDKITIRGIGSGRRGRR